MKYIRILIALTILFISCKNENVQKECCQVELIDFLSDSLNMFEDVQSLNLSGEIVSPKMKIKYYSISKSDFINAAKSNENNVSFFNRHFKLNEYAESNKDYRKDTILEIIKGSQKLSLVDRPRNKLNRAKRFFLESIIEPYVIVKKIQFEDAETFFWNSEYGTRDLSLLGTSVDVNKRDSLVFYSNTVRLTPEDSSAIIFYKIKQGKIDTLLSEEVNWFTNFSFFDRSESSIFYLHSFYKEYELYTTYAKMEYEFYPTQLGVCDRER